MARRATDGLQELIDGTGGGIVQSTVTVDQIYAQNQHESLNFKHPRGGQAKYLEAPMFSGYARWFQKFADGMLRGRLDVPKEWHDGPGKALQGMVPKFAPVEFDDLRRSAGLVTTVNREPKFEVPAEQPRLTDWELEGKDHLRASGLGYRD